MAAKFSFILIITLTSFISGCRSYQVSLNEMTVYQPPAVVQQINANDPALAQCLEQWIIDKAITQAKQLSAINCSNAGISQLEGVNQFSGLVEINLADNQLQTAAGLQGLSQLQRLNLSGNDLKQLQTLFTLVRLQWLDLTGNSRLNCQEVSQLAAASQAEVIAPQHCL